MTYGGTNSSHAAISNKAESCPFLHHLPVDTSLYSMCVCLCVFVSVYECLCVLVSVLSHILRLLLSVRMYMLTLFLYNSLSRGANEN